MSAGSKQEKEVDYLNTNPTVKHNQIIQNYQQQPADSIEEIIERLRQHIEDKKLSEEDFFENKDSFINIEEFKSIFKKIDFEIKKQDLQVLFSFNNPTKEEGYLSGNIFLNTFSDKLNLKKKNISFSYENLNLINSEKNHESEIKDKHINSQFKEFRNEILNIINDQERKDFEERKFKLQSARVQNKDKSSKSKLVPLTAVRRTSKNENKDNIPFSALSNKGKNTIQRPQTTILNSVQAKHKRPKSIKSTKMIINEALRKKEAEDELIKLSIEKRNKENERDCIIKMSEANDICEKLRIPLSYTVFISEEVCITYYLILAWG